MNTAIENLVKQTVAVVLSALITILIVNSIGNLAGTDINGHAYITAQADVGSNGSVAG